MKLERELSLLHVFSLAAGAMIGSGLFVLPGLAHAQVGPAVFVSYLLAGLLAITGMLSQAELLSAMPKAGGTYFYVRSTMGPAVGTADGLLMWFSLSLKGALALVGLGAVVSQFVAIDMHVVALLFCLAFVAINLLGIGVASRTQVILVAGVLAVLLLYAARGLPAVQLHHFEPFAPRGALAILSTAGFVFVSYGGLLKVASVAEEIKEPGRVIPLGMILTLLVVSLLYIVVVFVTTGVLGAANLDNSLTPISDGAAAFMGSWGRILVSIAAILAFISAANAGIMAASRYPLALSRDGLLPEFLQRIGRRFRTPYVSLSVTGAFTILVLFLRLDVLVKVASTVLILTYLFACLSMIILRESRLQNYQPLFRAPLYPWIQIIGIIGFGVLLFGMGREALFASLIIVIGGLFVYWFYGRIRTGREYALLHLVERITARELTTHSLETELKEIIRERDDLVGDRFDSVIERGIVLDIEKRMGAEDLFWLAADKMAPNLHVEADTLFRFLQEREKESSTALTPHLAIPHIIIEGERTFQILMARCREGAEFSKSAPDVHAVFVLVGTKDERNFHLRALAAIAQIVRDPHFEQRWMAARSEEALRDVVLLGERRRMMGPL